MLLVLCSIEHSPSAGLLWPLSARVLPAALAPPRCRSLGPWLSGALLPRAASQRERALLFPWLPFPRGSCFCKAAGVFGRPPALLHHQQQLPLCSSPCRQSKRRAGARALCTRRWTRSTAQQALESQKYAFVIARRQSAQNSPRYHTPPLCFCFSYFFFFCVWSVQMLILHALSLQETGTAWPVLLLLLSAALCLAFARLQGMFFLNGRMRQPAPGYTCALSSCS